MHAGARSQILPLLPGAADVWDWGQFLFNTVMNSLLFGILYKVLPKTRIPWLNALSGGAFVSLVLFLGQRLLVRLLIGTSYTAYGLVGSFIAVMIWVYYVSAILFLGAEFVRALSTFSSPVDAGPVNEVSILADSQRAPP